MLTLRFLCASGCARTVYLLDDGKDKKKRRWATRLGADVIYVSGRARATDETNGKSGNLNNALSQIYPEGVRIPLHEIVCIMDADQVRWGSPPWARAMRVLGQGRVQALEQAPCWAKRVLSVPLVFQDRRFSVRP